VPLVEISVDSPIVLGGRAHTRNHNKSRLMLVMKEGKGWNKFVRLSTLLIWPSFCGLVDCVSFSVSVIVLGVGHVRRCVALSIHTHCRTWQ
jgi:hypothetical protein